MSSLIAQLERLSIAPICARASRASTLSTSATRPSLFTQHTTPQFSRAFSNTSMRAATWLLPNRAEKKRSRKGRPRVPTGGSSRGTTVVWGDYGLRMCDHDRRISAKQLKIGEDAIKVRLKGMRYRLYKRVCANIGVYSSGNEARMGKGKGSFDYWATRLAVSKIVYELKGDIHEKVVRDAFRIAGNKLPGMWEFVKKGDPPVVGITKLDGVTLVDLRRPRREVPLGTNPTELNGALPGAPSTPRA